ncbi:hypothetical protein BAE44_0011526 [Dichanthelium oligosanthes]|uniref:Disease resistance R13L4/SHOC-2-like LRR domain-containing protein n=1 Tax=Dichanthelium oligosanthes TaxID=888268 RepID=A0A1E5VQQ0_9POAL|nr:hypothetical protein BAE44_0011526 [Dichanthelium oligosanthes]
MEELPSTITKLQRLAHLYVDYDVRFPDGMIGQMRSLEELRRYPLSLDSWLPAAPCSLRKLCIKNYPVYKVPNWMGPLGNLGVLELVMICVRPEDVEILGAIPTLLFLNITTAGGTNGRITVHGINGFRSLKYFSLRIFFCGTALEFQVGSMPNLEHVKLAFRLHKSRCLNNGASSLGIQHLSAISKVEVKIMADATIRGVARAINGAITTLPNRPTVRFETEGGWECEHFKRDETDEEEEEEDEDEQTDGEEVPMAQHEG